MPPITSSTCWTRRHRGAGRALPPAARGLALALLALGPAQAQPKPTPARPIGPPNYVVIVQDIHVDRPTAKVWKSAGGYCDIGAWLKTTCVYTSGSGGVGTNRLIAGRINEVMVARTSTSYTYAQPLVPNFYHGTVEILPDGSGSKIVWSIFYDDSDLADQTAKDADHVRRAKMFQAALQTMKTVSESP